MGVNLANLWKALWSASFPGSLISSTPSVGTMIGSSQANPFANLTRQADAHTITMTAAVGKSNAQPLDLLDITIVGGATEYETVDPQVLHELIASKADAKYKLTRDYGGVAWCYAAVPVDRGVYLVPRVAESGDPLLETQRRIYRFDPTAAPREVASIVLLDMTQLTPNNPNPWESELVCLGYYRGTWMAFRLINPPIDQIGDPIPFTIAIWFADGTYHTDDAVMPWEGAWPYVASRGETPRRNMIYDRRGFLIQLGTADPWHDPNWVSMKRDLRPMAADWNPDNDTIDLPWEYIVLVDPVSCEILWWNCMNWDARAQYAEWKRMVAFDALGGGGIQDITIERRERPLEDVLWILTKNRELQRYDLETYIPRTDPVTDPANNTPRGVRPIYYPAVAQVNTDVTITYQLLDMWGRPTVRSGAIVEAISCNALGGFWDGSFIQIKKRETSNIDGQVTFTYHSNEGTSGQTETILARVMD